MLKARIDVLCPWTLKTSLGFLSIPHFHPTRQGTGHLSVALACYTSLHSSATSNPGDCVKLVLRVEKAGSESRILWNHLSYALRSLWSLLWVRLLELQRLLSLLLPCSCPEAECTEAEWEEEPWENPGAGCRRSG